MGGAVQSREEQEEQSQRRSSQGRSRVLPVFARCLAKTGGAFMGGAVQSREVQSSGGAVKEEQFGWQG